MESTRQTSRALFEEHRETIELIGRLERGLATLAAGAPDAALVRAVAELERHLRHGIPRHFEFEEREIFPRMEDGEAADMAALLVEEHETMRATAATLAPLARAGAAGTLDAAGWKALQAHAGALCEQLTSHIDKEDRALLPLMDELIDDDTDRDLALAYASS
jgi:hemerythrin-like domain-containing protein